MTIDIRSILCPQDRSDTSGTALAYASMLAQWYGADLTVLEMIWVDAPPVHAAAAPAPVLLIPEDRADMTAELRRFVDTHSEPGRRTYVKLRDGPIVQGILDEARVISADLIVMGTHGRSGFERFILGSVTEKILRKAPCPVFTVTPGSEPAPTVARPFNAIVCPVDFSLPSHKALSYAQLLARQSGKRLILVHVLDLTGEVVPPGLGPEISAARRLREDQARHELHALVPEAVRQWCECTESVAIGRPYEEILRVAEDSRADLIVMGVHGRNSLDVALFGSTTNQVVRSADCPVLTVRS